MKRHGLDLNLPQSAARLRSTGGVSLWGSRSNVSMSSSYDITVMRTETSLAQSKGWTCFPVLDHIMFYVHAFYEFAK